MSSAAPGGELPHVSTHAQAREQEESSGAPQRSLREFSMVGEQTSRKRPPRSKLPRPVNHAPVPVDDNVEIALLLDEYSNPDGLGKAHRAQLSPHESTASMEDAREQAFLPADTVLNAVNGAMLEEFQRIEQAVDLSCQLQCFAHT